jgi:hypothetical protein
MADAEHWHEWTSSVRSIKLLDDGPMRIGSRALVRQPKFPPALWKVTALDPGRSFTWRTGAPTAWVYADHSVIPITEGSRARLRVSFDGPIARLMGRVTSAINSRYLALEASGLKRRSEERAASSAAARPAEPVRIHMAIAGLGIIFYSPWAVQHITPGTDYLETNFLEARDIARHVNASSLTGFGTGGPGDYELVISGQAPNPEARAGAQYSVELGLDVRGGTVCFRDLYDLIRWEPECPPDQSLNFIDGFYRVTVFTTPTPVDQTQFIYMSFVRVPEKLALHFTGAPALC